MKRPLVRPSSLILFSSVIALPLAAQPAATRKPTAIAAPPAHVSSPIPVQSQTVADLPRLKSKGKPGEVAPLARGKVTVNNLAPQGPTGARTAVRQDVIHLVLDPGKAWSRPLRGAANDTTFVTFLVNGSIGTTFDIGGACLAINPSTRAGYAQLTLGDENPLFVDANANGIDDAFEKQKRNGALLAANAPAADRQTLATERKSAQSAAKVAPWKIRRPVPDDAIAAVTPK